MPTYYDYYTHCGSSNHGLLIKWYTKDGVNLWIDGTINLQAAAIAISKDTDAYYNIADTTVYTGAASSTEYYSTNAAKCTVSDYTCAFPKV